MTQNKTLFKVISTILALCLWQGLSFIIHQPILLVGPIEVWQRLLALCQQPDFLISVGFSFSHITIGFFLGVLLGVLLGFLAGKYPILETLLWPYMTCIKSIPVASIVVICLIWLKAQRLSIFISFLIVLPVMYHNTLSGYRNTRRDLREMAILFRIKPLRRLWYLTLPQLKGYFIAGLSSCAGIAWKAGVAAEVIATPKGSIGQKLYLAKVYLATDDLLAWTLVLVIISILFEKLLLAVVKKILP